MKILIGILAWNEGSSIATTIKSLAGQTLLSKAGPGFSVEIVVVPNGCTDRTAAVAAKALDDLLKLHPAVHTRVEELAEGGKSQAWNALIHRFSPADADYHILLDADIELLTPGTLENLWAALEANPHAWISTDMPVKHLSRKPSLSLRDRILLAAGSMTQSAPGQLTGQLYCARSRALRRVVIPRGLIVDDGFLKQILCTDGYSGPVDNTRIVRAEDAGHVFECYTRFADIWNHQVRQAVGHTLYTCFTAALRRDWPERPIYEALRKRCAEDPDWLVREIREEIRRRGLWVMDRPSLWMRWRRVRFASGSARVRAFALALLAFPFDLAVFFASNARLRSGRVKGIWKDTRTTALP